MKTIRKMVAILLLSGACVTLDTDPRYIHPNQPMRLQELCVTCQKRPVNGSSTP